MKIAIPIQNNKLCNHFGHCQQFYICETDKNNAITKYELVTPPPHEPGLLPKWLGEKQVQLIITGGMGQRAQGLFAERNIKVCVGAPSIAPDILVEKYLNDELEYGDNVCDH
ncbi:MAG: NifB/NifX family molybdenum-iron cluster-binding protein [Eubacteriales bacterium]